MVLLLPNNSLQQEETLGPVTNEDIDSIQQISRSADAIRDKRSADAKLASELYAPSMLGELHS